MTEKKKAKTTMKNPVTKTKTILSSSTEDGSQIDVRAVVQALGVDTTKAYSAFEALGRLKFVESSLLEAIWGRHQVNPTYHGTLADKPGEKVYDESLHLKPQVSILESTVYDLEGSSIENLMTTIIKQIRDRIKTSPGPRAGAFLILPSKYVHSERNPDRMVSGFDRYFKLPKGNDVLYVKGSARLTNWVTHQAFYRGYIMPETVMLGLPRLPEHQPTLMFKDILTKVMEGIYSSPVELDAVLTSSCLSVGDNEYAIGVYQRNDI